MLSGNLDGSTRLAAERLTPPWLLDAMPSQGGVPPHLDRVVDAIEQLSARQRETIEAVFYERISQAELGRRRGVSRQSVNVTFHRALANLRRSLE